MHKALLLPLVHTFTRLVPPWCWAWSRWRFPLDIIIYDSVELLDPNQPPRHLLCHSASNQTKHVLIAPLMCCHGAFFQSLTLCLTGVGGTPSPIAKDSVHCYVVTAAETSNWCCLSYDIRQHNIQCVVPSSWKMDQADASHRAHRIPEQLDLLGL